MQSFVKQHRNSLAREHLERGCYDYEKGDIERAFSEFSRSSRLGDREAQLNLGNLYSSGELGFIDLKKAIYQYKKSIKQGSCEAAYNLAIQYKQLRRQKWYCFWLERAVALGDTDAAKEILDASEQLTI